MKIINIISITLIILGLLGIIYYLSFANTSDEGLSVGFATLGAYGSAAVLALGILILFIGWLINKNRK